MKRPPLNIKSTGLANREKEFTSYRGYLNHPERASVGRFVLVPIFLTGGLKNKNIH